MKALHASAILMIGFAIAPAADRAAAQPQQAISNAAATTQPAEIDRIIGTMLQRETDNATAKANYSFRRDEQFDTIGAGGQVTGEFHRVSDFIFDAHGILSEKILYFPIPSIYLPPEPVNGVLAIDDFSLNTTNIGRYYAQFAGKLKVDELNTFVFEITPKVADEHTFSGRIWVDDRDLMIIKVEGTFGASAALSHGPVLAIYRENIDGRYWFPTYIYADGMLQTGRGDEHVRLRTKYTNYHRARAA